MAKHLHEIFGVYVVDCDRIGHGIYKEPGSKGYNAVVRAFGEDIVDPDRMIDRRKLGGIVFGDQKQMQRYISPRFER